MKFRKYFLEFLIVTVYCFSTAGKIYAQAVYIPDSNFKKILLADTTINTNKDTIISVAEAAATVDTLNIQGKNIKDLTGIEAFTALTGLFCDFNQLTSLDVSSNTALISISCSGNSLTSLNISKCIALLQVSCYTNHLTSLNVPPSARLNALDCYNNNITSLNVSSNPALIWLTCNQNNLSSLDVSNNPNLFDLECGNNNLTSLNVKNGHNQNLNFFVATNNPGLKCIQVDNVAYANTNWGLKKDPWASFTLNALPTLYLTAFLQGPYLGARKMTNTLYHLGLSSDLTATDTITVNLWLQTHLQNAFPDTSVKVILHTNGGATAVFSTNVYGKSYYIALRHRNSLETWSANAVTFGCNTTYDFSSGKSKAYGNNEIDVKGEGIWSLYSGDINQDGGIDATDFLVLYPDIQSGKAGYLATDVNGDGAVDGNDFLMLYPNIQKGSGTIHP